MSLEAVIISILLLAIGFLFCFGGYRWFLILLPVWAFLTGFAIGAVSVSGVYGQSILSMIILVVAGLIVGLLLAVITYMFFNLAIILLGASFGYTVGSGIAIYSGFETGLVPVLAGLITAAAVGFLAFRLNLPKYVIIALTAFTGSGALMIGALLLMGHISLSNLELEAEEPSLLLSNVWIPIWLALAALGAATQLHKAKNYELDLEAGARKAGP